MKAVDKLPRSSEWKLKALTVEGDLLRPDGQRQTEEVELWLRDPVECIRELMADPTFRDDVCFEPQQAFDDQEGRTRRYDKMWTGEWWWEMQVSERPQTIKNRDSRPTRLTATCSGRRRNCPIDRCF